MNHQQSRAGSSTPLKFEEPVKAARLCSTRGGGVAEELHRRVAAGQRIGISTVNAECIKGKLARYKILAQRRTTIAHSFASALAPTDTYDAAAVLAALAMLPVGPTDNLSCVYCASPAETWDHVYALVVAGKFSGFGHQLGNLVPCCKPCNSRKGSKHFENYLRELANPARRKRPWNVDALIEPDEAEDRIVKIQAYVDRYLPASARAAQTDLESDPRFARDLQRYEEKKAGILVLMQEADEIAEKLVRAMSAAASVERPGL